ncbi:MAG: TonB-dependent receptor [Bdellovibrionales bacterium]|nr:TonB-dependent receptor [Bdellovibrionales bacterium]
MMFELDFYIKHLKKYFCVSSGLVGIGLYMFGFTTVSAENLSPNSSAFAQNTSKVAVINNNDVVIPEITVLGLANTSLAGDRGVISTLSGKELEKRKQSSLGETLSREVGVHSSFYGPHTSRPVLRGLEGDRVPILQNGVMVTDASSLSPDHAVAVEPFSLDKIEIIRGPDSFKYGVQAFGGVVNLVTHRIPEKVPEKHKGHAEARFSSVDLGRSGNYGGDTHIGKNWAFHWDAAERASDDYRSSAQAGGRVKNSFNRVGTGSMGVTRVFDQGFLGTSFTDYHSKYGTIADPSVYIKLSQQHWDVAGERRNWGGFNSIKFNNSYSRYHHEEIEDGEEATKFKNSGNESRLDFQRLIGPNIDSQFGFQYHNKSSSALGEEAFMPSTKNSLFSIYTVGRGQWGKWIPTVGFRYEQNQVRSEDSSFFGVGKQKSFDGLNGSVELKYQLKEGQNLVLNGTMTERAPSSEELFANGPHVATGYFQVGSDQLPKEQSRSLEFSWQYQTEEKQSRMAVFVQDYKNYLSLFPTGSTDSGSGLPIAQYESRPARVYGWEVEWGQKLPQNFLKHGVLSYVLKADLAHGVDRSTGAPLPRTAPLRESVALVYKANRYQTDLELQRVEAVTRTAVHETSTGGYTLVNMGVESPLIYEKFWFNFYFKAQNIFDVKARNHMSLIKDLAPLPGRNFIVGLQSYF